MSEWNLGNFVYFCVCYVYVYEMFTLCVCTPPAFFAFNTNTNETACGRKSSNISSNLSHSPIPGVSTNITFPYKYIMYRHCTVICDNTYLYTVFLQSVETNRSPLCLNADVNCVYMFYRDPKVRWYSLNSIVTLKWYGLR